MDRNGIAIRQNGQGVLRRLRRQADADFIPGEDQHAHPAQVLVAARVVAMNVGVDQEPDLGVRDPSDRGHDLVRERRELVVDHDDAVLAHRDADVPTLSCEVVDAPRDVMCHDLDIVESSLGVRFGRHRGAGQCENQGSTCEVEKSFHGSAPNECRRTRRVSKNSKSVEELEDRTSIPLRGVLGSRGVHQGMNMRGLRGFTPGGRSVDASLPTTEARQD